MLAGGSGVQGYPWLHSELEASLGYMRSYLSFLYIKSSRKSELDQFMEGKTRGRGCGKDSLSVSSSRRTSMVTHADRNTKVQLVIDETSRQGRP